MRVGGAHDQRTQSAHLGVQQANGIISRVIGAERIGTDELGKPIGVVGLGWPHRPHLVQYDADAGFGDLPGSFGAGEAAANDMDGRGRVRVIHHGAQVARFAPEWNPICREVSTACALRQHAAEGRTRQRPREAGVGRSQTEIEQLVLGTGSDTLNVRAIDADIGELAIAELGQLVHVALVIPERLDHADEREEHGNLLVFTIQLFKKRCVVEANIEPISRCNSSIVAMQLIE